jgi:hypothetical protein
MIVFTGYQARAFTRSQGHLGSDILNRFLPGRIYLKIHYIDFLSPDFYTQANLLFIK